MSETASEYNPFTYQFSLSQFSFSSISDKKTYDPAKVLLIKRLPFNASELDVINFAKYFGIIEDVYLIKNKGYAYVQFKDIDMAIDCFDKNVDGKGMILNCQVFIYHTGKSEIFKNEGKIAFPTKKLAFSFETEIEDDEVVVAKLRDAIKVFGTAEKMTVLSTDPLLVEVQMKEIESAIRLKETLDDRMISNDILLHISYFNGKQTLEKPSLFVDTQRKCDSLNGSAISSPLLKDSRRLSEEFQKLVIEPPIKKSSYFQEEFGCKTVLIRNLPENVTPDELYNLFGMYGNVQRVKIFYKNPENALVQYQEPEQAFVCKENLNNCLFRNKNILVCMSKTEISFSSNEESRYYKEYFKQRGQRYRKAGSKNFKNIAPPSKVLHVSNLIPEKDENFYLNLFSRFGNIVKFTVLNKETTTLLIEMDTLDQAVEALIQLHNFEISQVYLKVSFSKYDTIKTF